MNRHQHEKTFELSRELANVNDAMNGAGRAFSKDVLIFYGPAVAHKVEFHTVPIIQARYKLSTLDRFRSEWGWLEALFDTPLGSVVDALKTYQPFLPLDQIDTYWEGVVESSPTESARIGFANWH